MRRIFIWFQRALLLFTVLAGLLVGAMYVAQYAAGYQLALIQTGSMEPTIMTGDAVLTKPAEPSEITVGDIIAVHDERESVPVMHRVTSIHEHDSPEINLDADTVVHLNSVVVRMTGDANMSADPRDYVLTSAEDASVAVTVNGSPVVIPNGDRVIGFLNSKQFFIAIGVAVIVLLGWSWWSSKAVQSKKA